MKVKEKQVRYGGILVLTFILPFVFGYREGQYWKHVLHTFAITFSNWQGCVWVMGYFQKKYPTYSLTRPRILSEIAAFVVLILVIVVVHTALIELLYGIPFQVSNLFHNITGNAMITLFACAFYESRYFFGRWNESLTETQRLRRQTTQSQLEVLKNQVNPHFLFNSLNTLLTLIPEDKQTAKKFTRKLEKVYQYILQYQHQELVTVAAEFEFIKAYLFLQQMRFGENLQVNIHIEPHYLQYQMVPLSLQMLVENAIKHNVVSQTKPLLISISVEAGKLQVKNNLQLKSRHYSTRTSTKIGLKNIQNRYQYFTQETVDIHSEHLHFEVKLPLLLPTNAPQSSTQPLTLPGL